MCDNFVFMHDSIDDQKCCYNCIYRYIVEPDNCDDIPFLSCLHTSSPLYNKVTLDYDKCDYFRWNIFRRHLNV
jgi:hypothetical protein